MGNRFLDVSPRKKRLMVFGATVACVVLIDQIIKLCIVVSMQPGESTRLIGDFLRITYIRNAGAAFGLLSGSTQFVFWAALLVIVFTLLWAYSLGSRGSMWAFLGLGLMVGGAVGNIIDRIFRGKVVDYIDLSFWPVFNFADLVIVVGVIIIVASLIFSGPAGSGDEEDAFKE